VKSGFFTSEFWLAAAAMLATALTGILSSVPQTLTKVNPVLGLVAGSVIPAAIAWITHKYIDSRTTVKTAALAATATPGAIVATLNK